MRGAYMRGFIEEKKKEQRIFLETIRLDHCPHSQDSLYANHRHAVVDRRILQYICIHKYIVAFLWRANFRHAA